MPDPQDELPKKLVFNDGLLKAFIEGRLEPAVEQKVACYLDARPELLAKITSACAKDISLDELRECNCLRNPIFLGTVEFQEYRYTFPVTFMSVPLLVTSNG